MTTAFFYAMKTAKIYHCKSVHLQNIQVYMYSCTIPWYYCTLHQHCTSVFL